MVRTITLEYISKNEKILQKAGIVNGIGEPGKWYTKLFKTILWFTSENKRSRFYEASVYHDTLYWVGGTEKDREKADVIFLNKMFETNKKLFRNNLKTLGLYSIEAFLFYVAVRSFGKRAFNYTKTKRTIDDIYEKMDENKNIIRREDVSNDKILADLKTRSVYKDITGKTPNIFDKTKKTKLKMTTMYLGLLESYTLTKENNVMLKKREEHRKKNKWKSWLRWIGVGSIIVLIKLGLMPQEYIDVIVSILFN